MLHYQYYEYENGLEVVLKNADFNDAFILFGVCMGPLYESAEMSGASHFIEHLFFQTPAKGSKKKHLENLEWRGISANAETSQEYLTIEMTCSSRKTDIVLEALYNEVTIKKYLPEDFAAEQGIIRREMDWSHDEPSQYVEDYLFFPALYQGKKKKKKILGTKENLESFTPELLFAYRQQFMYPENMVIVVAGNFNERKVCKKIEETFALLNATGKKRPVIPPYRNLVYPSLVEEYRPGIRQTYIQRGCRTPGYTEEDHILLHFLAHVLGTSNVFSSRLGYALGTEGGYSYDFGTKLESFPQTAMFSNRFAIAPEEEKEALSALKSIYRDLSRHKMKKSELEGVKTRILTDDAKLEEGTRELFKHIAYGLKYDLLSDAYKKRIKEITTDEVLASAQKYLRKRQLTAILRPER